MRARRSAESSSLLVVVLMVASACSSDEEAAAVVPPEPDPPEPTANTAPLPLLEPPREVAPSRRRLVSIGGNPIETDAGDIGDVPTRALTRLVYQCSDEVTFAVRTLGDRLEVVPPGVANSYVVLTRMPVDSGVRFTAPNADLRADGDLATLHIGTERYVDCVSNPAAAVWGTVQPIATR